MRFTEMDTSTSVVPALDSSLNSSFRFPFRMLLRTCKMIVWLFVMSTDSWESSSLASGKMSSSQSGSSVIFQMRSPAARFGLAKIIRACGVSSSVTSPKSMEDSDRNRDAEELWITTVVLSSSWTLGKFAASRTVMMIVWRLVRASKGAFQLKVILFRSSGSSRKSLLPCIRSSVL